MTSYMSPSDRKSVSASYQSSVWFDSEACPGARYAVARMSLGRRIELARRLREIGRRAEYLEAASDAQERLEGATLGAEIDRAYLEWGLLQIEGLEIDGEAATPALLAEKWPAEVASEILARIKAQCGLTEAERKN